MVKGDKQSAPTVNENLNKLCNSYWSQNSSNKHKQFSVDVIANIYQHELVQDAFLQRKIVFLEFSQYLEAFLWKNYSPKNSSKIYILSIVIMVNEKFRERITAWQCFIEKPDFFTEFFQEVLQLSLDDDLSYLEQTAVITFLDNCFNSLEIDVVRKEVTKLCSLPIWINLIPSKRNDLLSQNVKLKKFWIKVEQKFAQMSEVEFATFDFHRRILWRLLQKFKKTVDDIDDETKTLDVNAITYCERFLMLLIDLEAQLTTRRFFNSLLLSSQVITHCLLSQLVRAEHGSLFCDLLTMLKFYARFEIDDVTGKQLTNSAMTKKHYDYVMSLQKAMFKFFPDTMSEFSFLNVASVDTRKFLKEQLSALSSQDLYKIAQYLFLVPDETLTDEEQQTLLADNYGRFRDVDYLTEMIIFFCERRPSQLQKINNQPMYPSEKVIWDENLVPYEHYDGHNVLPLNKLNLQFLTIHDYLLRNFNLFQMESTYEVRQDLEDVLFRMKPFKHEFNPDEVVWGGWAKMALPITGCRIVQVGKPNVGESSPSEVKADVSIVLPRRQDLRFEWENLRKNDVMFLLKVNATAPIGTKFDVREPFKNQFKISLVRGCEIEGILGPEGRVVEEMESRDILKRITGDTRTYRVKFDTNQYQIDMENNETDLYFSFNLLIRRDPKANNFKAVLATIRQLLNTECVVPEWLHDIILGYGEPNVAHYSKMNEPVTSANFNDTFLSYEHLVSAFPHKNVVFSKKHENEVPTPPFRLTFNELVAQHGVSETERDHSIRVENEDPKRSKEIELVANQEYRQNSIEFTQAQIEAIKSGMQPGLTMIVGPPGTGKTDVAVQIIANIYHNWPQQRTLIVTHSNQALNQLFEKIMALDVDERHLLRMGHGEEALETTKDFSRYGRVTYVLKERNLLLRKVDKLSKILGEIGDVAYSCETAGYFYRYTVVQTWEHFVDALKIANDTLLPDSKERNEFVSKNFPFSKYFSTDKKPIDLFKEQSLEEDLRIAKRCYAHIQEIFTKLEEFLAFELLRNGRDRADYLLVKEAKIIAMTCTHAALRRKDLVEMGFRYDNILMEESAQILEVETFIPLLLQNPQDGRYRLKRWIMIGDHKQLPPVVQNVAYQKFSNMEQSLFARLIRLGVPNVELDSQGRARSEIANLYNWRYNNLGDLPHIQNRPEFRLSNPGFLYTYQLIDVPDFNGIGESTPSPYFYQNLGEAEYAVALFSYMRILGYPAERISIITTYNGQASLIRDVVGKRCADNPLIGQPAKISTVDKYQGQQNDYIILSLVRTRFVGHLRDVRRLVVALSRARLGLYVLGRVSLFRSCFELKTAFDRLLKNPTQLCLLPNELFNLETHTRQADEKPSIDPLKIVDAPHLNYFIKEFYNSNLELLKARYIEESRQKNARVASFDTEEIPEMMEQQSVEPNADNLPVSSSIAALDAVSAGQQQQASRNPNSNVEERPIVFEQVDFERLEQKPNYG